MNTLRSREDFTLLFRRGKRKDSRLFTVIIRKNSLSGHRFAFITPRSISQKAVVRNLLRRRAREWIRKHPLAIPYTVDLLFIFKKEAVAISRKVFYEELEKAFNSLPTLPAL